MNRAKSLVIGLSVALVSIAAMASASAFGSTVLCTKNEKICAKSNVMPAGSGVGGYVSVSPEEEGALTIKASNGITFSCGFAMFGGATKTESGAAGLEIDPYAYVNNCMVGLSKPENNCVSANPKPQWGAAIMSGNGPGGSLFFEGARFSLHCTMPLGLGEATCTYLLPVVGPTYEWPSTWSLKEKSLEFREKESTSAFLCGKSAKLNATLWSVMPSGAAFSTN